MMAGTNRQRTMVASTATAVERPTPNILTIALSDKMNDPNTVTMIRAAAVTSRPVSASPRRTATTMSPLRSQCSRKAVSRNTS